MGAWGEGVEAGAVGAVGATSIRLPVGLTFIELRRETAEAAPKLLRKQKRGEGRKGRRKTARRWGVMVHNEASAGWGGRRQKRLFTLS